MYLQQITAGHAMLSHL